MCDSLKFIVSSVNQIKVLLDGIVSTFEKHHVEVPKNVATFVSKISTDSLMNTNVSTSKSNIGNEKTDEVLTQSNLIRSGFGCKVGDKRVLLLTGLYTVAAIKELNNDLQDIVNNSCLDAVVTQIHPPKTIVLHIPGLSLHIALTHSVYLSHVVENNSWRRHYIDVDSIHSLASSSNSHHREKYEQLLHLFVESPRHVAALALGCAPHREEISTNTERQSTMSRRSIASSAMLNSKLSEVEIPRTRGQSKRVITPYTGKHDSGTRLSVLKETVQSVSVSIVNKECDKSEADEDTTTCFSALGHSVNSRKSKTKVTAYLAKFNNAQVGDKAVFALKGLYYEADLADMDAHSVQMIRTSSIDATVVQKDSDSLVLGVGAIGVYIMLTPWQYRTFVNISTPPEHHLTSSALVHMSHSNKVGDREKYGLIVKLFQETTNCIYLMDYTPESAAAAVSSASVADTGVNMKATTNVAETVAAAAAAAVGIATETAEPGCGVQHVASVSHDALSMLSYASSNDGDDCTGTVNSLPFALEGDALVERGDREGKVKDVVNFTAEEHVSTVDYVLVDNIPSVSEDTKSEVSTASHARSKHRVISVSVEHMLNMLPAQGNHVSSLESTLTHQCASYSATPLVLKRPLASRTTSTDAQFEDYHSGDETPKVSIMEYGEGEAHAKKQKMGRVRAVDFMNTHDFE